MIAFSLFLHHLGIWEGSTFHSFEKTHTNDCLSTVVLFSIGEQRTCSFVLHKHVESNSPYRACVCGGALMLGHWCTAEGVQHDGPLVSRAWDEDIVNSPVILVQAIMSWLPPAEASSNLFSIRREKDIHKSIRKRWQWEKPLSHMWIKYKQPVIDTSCHTEGEGGEGTS